MHEQLKAAQPKKQATEALLSSHRRHPILQIEGPTITTSNDGLVTRGSISRRNHAYTVPDPRPSPNNYDKTTTPNFLQGKTERRGNSQTSHTYETLPSSNNPH